MEDSKLKIIDKAIEPLKRLYAVHRKPNGSISEQTKSAQCIGEKWLEGFKETDTEVEICDNSREKIDVVDKVNGIAYELKVSGKNVKHEFYKDVFKVLVYNKDPTKESVSTFVFISEQSGIDRLETSTLYKETWDIVKSKSPSLEVILKGI